MKKDLYENKKNNWSLYFKAFLIEIIITAVFILGFALVMYFTESAFNYAPIFATVSIAIGAFATAYYSAKRIGNKGFLTGLMIGGITFIVITLISLIIDDGAVTINTLFHLIIILLASLIGGVWGVNKDSNKKYI